MSCAQLYEFWLMLTVVHRIAARLDVGLDALPAKLALARKIIGSRHSEPERRSRVSTEATEQ